MKSDTSPYPADAGRQARLEIDRLRKALLSANEKWLAAVMKRELDSRSIRGEIQALRKVAQEVARLQGQGELLDEAQEGLRKAVRAVEAFYGGRAS